MKKVFVFVEIVAFVMVITVNINAGLNKIGEIDITLNTIESQAQEGDTIPSHRRPLMDSNKGNYKHGSGKTKYLS